MTFEPTYDHALHDLIDGVYLRTFKRPMIGGDKLAKYAGEEYELGALRQLALRASNTHALYELFLDQIRAEIAAKEIEEVAAEAAAEWQAEVDRGR
jgi:hypothetical protein